MRIVLVGFEQAQGLDVFGPAEVFAYAARDGANYRVVLASPAGGEIKATSGIPLVSTALASITPRPSDTVLAVGGDARAVQKATQNRHVIAWLVRAASVVRRIGSVCSGAFLLARAGILDGRRAATHWSDCQALKAQRPQVDVDSSAIFVKDGNVWTSAGVTAGIDLALALVEEDHGHDLAARIAARLVVYARRPGYQSQFSEALVAQTLPHSTLSEALDALRERPGRFPDIVSLARKAGLSLRTLHRRCQQELDVTPAKLVERVRAEHAKLLLTTTGLGTKTVAARAGFDSPVRMARAFQRTFGVSPREFRRTFGS
jgi:transcriptional regulator GlxA family with amidase domain